MTERIMTLHPAGKTGVNIEKHKYDTIRSAILAIIEEGGTVPFKGLADAVAEHLDGNFDGSFGWYTTSVKLDLEARGLIERIPKKSPQQLRLTPQ